MKKILMAAVAAMTMAFAGGNITPIEPQVVVPTTNDFYVGAGISAYTLYVDGEKDFFNDTDESEIAGGLEAKLGYVFYRNGAFSTAIEGQIGRTMWGMDSDDIDYTYNYGVFVKPTYNFTNDISAYALLGYARVGIEFDDDSYHEDGFSYGIGAEYTLTTEWSVYGEYVMLPEFDADIDDIENDKITIGVNYKF